MHEELEKINREIDILRKQRDEIISEECRNEAKVFRISRLLDDKRESRSKLLLVQLKSTPFFKKI